MRSSINGKSSTELLRLTVLGILGRFVASASLRVQTIDSTNGRKAQEIIPGVTMPQVSEASMSSTNSYPGDPYKMNCCPAMGMSVVPNTACCQSAAMNSGNMYSNTMCCPGMPLQLLTLTQNETQNVTLTAPTEVLLTIRVTPINRGHNSLPEFRREVVDSHNEKRAIHDAPALIMDGSLNLVAQNFANSLASQRKVAQSRQEIRLNQGENVAQQCKTNGLPPPPGQDMTEMWYREVSNYDWETPGYAQNTAHFSQLVWKGTSMLGVGLAQYKKNDETCYVAVVRYTPKGNTQGQFPENVLKGTYITKREEIPSPE